MEQPDVTWSHDDTTDKPRFFGRITVEPCMPGLVYVAADSQVGLLGVPGHMLRHNLKNGCTPMSNGVTHGVDNSVIYGLLGDPCGWPELLVDGNFRWCVNDGWKNYGGVVWLLPRVWHP